MDQEGQAAFFFQMGEKTKYFSKRLLKALGSLLQNPLTVVEAPTGYGTPDAPRIPKTVYLIGSGIIIAIFGWRRFGPALFLLVLHLLFMSVNI